MTKDEAIHILRDSKPSTSIGEEKVLERVANVCFAIDMAIEALKEQKVGKWFDSVNKYDAMANKHNYFCQECKNFAMDFISGTEDWWCNRMPNYCPHCGAKMEGEEE